MREGFSFASRKGISTPSISYCQLKGRDQRMCWDNECVLYSRLQFKRLKTNEGL